MMTQFYLRRGIVKKKLFVGLAAATLAAVMCVSFAACGDKTPDAKDTKGVEVTAEQWTAAFEALAKEDAEYTFTMVTTYNSSATMTDPETSKELKGDQVDTRKVVYSKKGNKEYEARTETLKISGDARRIMVLMGMSESELPEKDTTTETEERYGKKTADGYVLYVQEDGKWTKGSGSSFSPVSEFDSYKTGYENYTYSEENKGYIPKDYSAEDGGLEVIKFDKNGNLVAIYMEWLETAETNTSDIVTTTTVVNSYTIQYSAKDIKLPKVA